MFGRARALKVLVDGELVGDVRHGATLETTVPAGPHEVRAKMDWVKSPPLGVDCTDAPPIAVEVTTTNFLLATVFSLFYWPGVFRLRVLPPGEG